MVLFLDISERENNEQNAYIIYCNLRYKITRVIVGLSIYQSDNFVKLNREWGYLRYNGFSCKW